MPNLLTLIHLPMAAALCLAFAPEEARKETIELDLSGKLPGKEWKAIAGAPRVENKELVGTGAVRLECARSLEGDFTLSFEAWTQEKAGIEVKLFDESGRKELYTFAFLGRYHSVLDGVKSAILKDGQFVQVDPRTWIFPGRFFKFRVERSGKTFRMLLDGQAGPEFQDPAPPAALKRFKIQIAHESDGAKDQSRFKNVRLEIPQAGAGK